MLAGTIFITMGILGTMTVWHFWKHRKRFKESFEMYAHFLQSKKELENLQKAHKKP